MGLKEAGRKMERASVVKSLGALNFLPLVLLHEKKIHPGLSKPLCSAFLLLPI